MDYYRRAREVFLKPPEMPVRYATEVKWGCPYDCGLCTDHEQHSCLSLVEVTDHCNLRCPICYAASGPDRPVYRSLDQVTAMLDAVVRNEREPDVVQISGGEPTIHPEFFAILDAARARPIRHLMVNTNGLRIAQDPAFARRLADGPAGAYARMKRNFAVAAKGDLALLLQEEARNMSLSVLTSEAREAGRAFVEKRRPDFLGKTVAAH